MHLPLQLMLAVALAGCGGGAMMEQPMLAGGATAIALVDPDTLQPILDGGPGQVVHGPQGGYHVLVSLLAHGIWPGTLGVPGSPDDPTTRMRAFRADGTELTLTVDDIDTLHVAYMPGADGVTLTNKQLRLAITSPADVANQRLTLHVDVSDRDGRAASDEKHVIAIPPMN